jgi:hypothetical protein
MKNPFLVLTPCLLACGLLAGCSSGPACGDPHPYTQSVSGPRLKAPPGLTLPAPDPAYVIPQASTVTAPAAASASGSCMVIPPDVLSPSAQTQAKPAAAAPASDKVAQPVTTPPPAASHNPPPVAAHGPME